MLDRLVASAVPGVAIAVVDEGSLVFSAAYGFADPARGVAATPETVFQAASLSKPVAALGILAMVDGGLIGLDDDVEPLLGLPIGRHRLAGSVPAGSITVRRLLRHRGGIVGRDTTPTRDGEGYATGGGGSHRLPDRPGIPVPTLEDSWFGRRGSSPAIEVTYRPDGRESYSGAGFLVLQRLVEAVTGQTFAAWLNGRVLAPLGMSDATFAIRSAKRRWSAVGHDRAGQPLPWGREVLPWSAAGGLFSSAPSLARVVLALGGVGPEIVSADLIAEMRRDGLGIFPRRVGTADETLVHGGSNDGFRSLMAAFPNRRAGIVVLTNGAASDGEQLRLDLAGKVLAAGGLPRL